MQKQKYVAIVTGGSSGIGKAIADRLHAENFTVFALGRHFSFEANYEQIVCDVSDSVELEKRIKMLLKQNGVNVLINCAGFGEFKAHEELSLATITSMIDTNLKAPIILSNLCLRSLKEAVKEEQLAHIINISSIEATRHSKFSALYTATKSGLRDFSLALFEELRKSGVRVTSINPDLTNTNFFKELSFACNPNDQYSIQVEELADTVMEILYLKSVVTDVTLRPQQLKIEKKK
jgi:short-subunit dehydrogenase